MATTEGNPDADADVRHTNPCGDGKIKDSMEGYGQGDPDDFRCAHVPNLTHGGTLAGGGGLLTL